MNALRIKCLTLLLVCSAAFPGIQAQQEPFSRAGKDHALLFAVRDYQEWGSLKNPIHDAEAIARVLEHKYGFTTTIIRNPSLDKIHQTIQQYLRACPKINTPFRVVLLHAGSVAKPRRSSGYACVWRLASVQNNFLYSVPFISVQALSRPFSDDEQLFIYFSGHVEFVPYPNNPEEGKGYFIPADAKRHDPYRRSYLSWIDLLPDIDNIACKHIMLVVDACYSGSILKGKSGRPNELSHAEQFFLEVLPYPTRLALTSGGNERTPDGHYHSPLTEKLLSAFAGNGGPNGVLSFYELYGYLQDIRPRPRNGYFGRHDVNSDFLFLYQPPSSARFVTDPDGNRYPIVRLAGKQWLGRNLNLEVPGSYCYDDDPANCEEYGRLYTWEAAKVACSRLGPGWRLPTDEEWRGLLEAHGGYYDFSKGEEIGDAKRSCSALIQGGSSSFAALLGGGRDSGGKYLYLGRSGSYWSATEYGTEYGTDKTWYYTFTGDGIGVDRNFHAQSPGLSCRCLKGAPSNGID